MEGLPGKASLAILPAMAFVSSVFGQNGYPISTERPSFSDGTGIIPKGRWQVESGYTLTLAASSEFQTFGELLIRFPVGKNLEVRLLNVTFGKANAAGGGGDGLLDPIVGAKYRFQTGVAGKTPDMALELQSTVPAGSANFRVGRYQPTAKWAGYYQADATNGFGWNLVWSHLGKADTAFHQWAYSAYWSKTLSAKAGYFAELYHLMPASKDGPHATFADTGLTYLLNRATQVDFRVGSGLNQKRDGWFVGAGIAFRF